MSFLAIPEIKEHRFEIHELDKAKKLQMKMQRHYGYKPEILNVIDNTKQKTFLLIVKPKGLKKI